jgi:hypothetical protein
MYQTSKFHFWGGRVNVSRRLMLGFDAFEARFDDHS